MDLSRANLQIEKPDVTDRWLVSVDDHIVEPRHTWETWLPQKYKDQGPRLIEDERGEAWHYAGGRFPTSGLTAAAGKGIDEFSPFAVPMSEMRPGCYDPSARVKDMNRNHTLASTVFPTFAGMAGNRFYETGDLEVGVECIRAYNNFLLQEWCPAEPGRYVPIIILPLWDIDAAVEELERCIPLGAKAIGFPENPTLLVRNTANGEVGLPSIHDHGGYWDRLFAVANEARLPILIHTGTRSKSWVTSHDAPIHVAGCTSGMTIPSSVAFDWLFSGHFQRLPNLKIMLSEGGIGWFPAAMDAADYQFRHHHTWLKKVGDFDLRNKKGGAFTAPDPSDIKKRNTSAYDVWDNSEIPSEIWKKHIYGCFFVDEYGAKHLDEIGVENVMVEVDYPHSDSTWPNSLEAALRQMSRWDRDVQDKVLYGNAVKLFNLDLPNPAVMAQ